MTSEDELAIRQLPGAFDRLTRALHDAASRRRRAVLAFIALLVVGLGGTYCQSKSNGEILTIIETVTGPEAQRRQAANTVSILHRNAVETDCRARRAGAGLPAPTEAPPAPPGLSPQELAAFLAPYTCAAQTDPDVYPGRPSGQP